MPEAHQASVDAMNGKIPDLGVGLGLRVPHYAYVLKHKPKVDFFEIISENFMVEGGKPLRILDAILERYPVVLHGVSMYLGSCDPLNREHLKRLKALVRRTKAPWVSDHLCWGSVDGRYSHDLLPLPYTSEVVRHVARRIREARDFLEVPFAIENLSSYAAFKDSVMTEWEFLSEVAEAADCGILLDVNNIYVSSRNHGFDPEDYVRYVSHQRVYQMHLAGHTRRERILLDTHDHSVPDPVWDLYLKAQRLTGPVSTILERDARIPPFGKVLEEALRARPLRPERALCQAR